MRKKRSFLAVMGLLVGTMSFAGGTAAYLSKSAGEVKNVFTAGSVKAQLTRSPLGYAKSVKGLSRSDPGKRSGCKKYRGKQCKCFSGGKCSYEKYSCSGWQYRQKNNKRKQRIVYISGRRDEVDSSLFRRKPQETKNIFTAIKVF